MAKKIKYPLGIQTFSKVREGGYLYVDKTALMYDLIDTFDYVFLSRPRRFGKSLLMTTLESYFRGEKELFEGLAISRLEKDWESYPVLHIDLSGRSYNDKDSLKSLLDLYLEGWETEYGIKEKRNAPDERFAVVIRTAAEITGKNVVVLIDEYDTPLSDTIDNKELQDVYRGQLHGFYSVLKKVDRYIKFCMLTGVTKFGKVSVFSGLNNLTDITFDDRYAAICGITEEELHEYFASGVAKLAAKYQSTVEEVYDKLKYNYDGYHFSECMLDIYNPFSVLNALDKTKITGYWTTTGMPTIISKSLSNLDYDLETLNGTIISQEALENLSVYKTDPVSLLYQTGYLTLKSYDPDTDLFTLGYPNREVERGILNDLLEFYIPSHNDSQTVITQMRQSLRNGRPEDFLSQLKTYLSSIPSKLRTRVSEYENYYHTIFYCIMSLIGLEINVEYNTSAGFIDVVIETKDYIYIIELKINGSAATAMRQIEKKHYAAPFALDARKLFKIGIGFSKKTANITSTQISERN